MSGLSREIRWLILIMFVMMLGSCSGSDTTSTTLAETAATSSTAGEELESDVVAITTPPCDLLTADDVTTATGLASAEGQDSPPLSCTFDVGEASGVAIFLSIEDGQGRMAGPAALFAAYSDDGSESIPDLGEAAVYSQDFRALAVNAGEGRFIAVGVNGGYSLLEEPRDSLVELASIVLGRL